LTSARTHGTYSDRPHRRRHVIIWLTACTLSKLRPGQVRGGQATTCCCCVYTHGYTGKGQYDDAPAGYGRATRQGNASSLLGSNEYVSPIRCLVSRPIAPVLQVGEIPSSVDPVVETLLRSSIGSLAQKSSCPHGLSSSGYSETCAAAGRRSNRWIWMGRLDSSTRNNGS